ncbi:hypothetical protein ES703_116524 [subsurface metagenome]
MKKLLIDADCIIKISKAGIKERVLDCFNTFISESVRQEVIERGLEKGCEDAIVVKNNIVKGKLKTVENRTGVSGDEAIIKNFNRTEYDFVGTDDKRFIKRLVVMDIPYLVPGLLIYHIFQSNKISKEEGLSFLEKLSLFVSDDEYQIVRFLLKGE